MVTVDVPRVRGKMAEKGYSITSLSGMLKISRNTLSAYFENPEKMPYGIVSELAGILCDTPEEAKTIFFAADLRKTKEQERDRQPSAHKKPPKAAERRASWTKA